MRNATSLSLWAAVRVCRFRDIAFAVYNTRFLLINRIRRRRASDHRHRRRFRGQTLLTPSAGVAVSGWPGGDTSPPNATAPPRKTRRERGEGRRGCPVDPQLSLALGHVP